MAKRGRRPKKADSAEAVEVSVQPGVSKEHDEAHVALQQQREHLKHKGGVKEEWWVMQGYKLLKKSRYANGNVYTVYEGKVKNNPKTQAAKAANDLLKARIEKLKKSGDLRPA